MPELPSVFISYSHKDELWKDRLLPQLKALEQAGVLDVWEDRRIDAGDQWYPEIRAAMEKAAVSVCLISPDYLASDFCAKEEVPFMLKRCEQEGMVLLPVLLRPCVWKVHRWLKDTQMWPRDGKTVAVDFENKWDVPFAQVAEQICDRVLAGIELKQSAERSTGKLIGLIEKSLPGDLSGLLAGILGTPAATGAALPIEGILGGSRGGDQTSLPPPSPAPAPPAPRWPAPEKIDITRLPSTGMDVFGRDKELNLLDEVWEKQEVKVISFVAWGGVGKSTLVNKWLEAMQADNYRGARRVYAWSFYSQGTSSINQGAASADLFIDQALRWFGDADPTAGTPWDKGERLAALIRQQRTLLLLDGLEPLQSPHAHERGKLKDPALLTLLEELARDNSPGPGLCVITTRERLPALEDGTGSYGTGSVSDLSIDSGRMDASGLIAEAQVANAPRSVPSAAFIQLNLETLSPAAARAFLRVGGVRGTDEELTAAAESFGSHALALKLLAEYLRDITGHSITEAARIPDLDISVDAGKHPRRVIAALAARFGAGAESEVLRLLGLFDRTADGASLAALRKAPKIAGLTDHIGATDEANWLRALQRLRKYKLLDAESHHAPDELEAHPLVREHFRDVLQQTAPDAWRAANDRLYEHLTRTAKDLPDTLAEMEPLFAAIAHGCAAGRLNDAYWDVHWRRIHRENEGFVIKKLGAIGADLGALRNFFATPWRQPLAELKPAQQGFILNQAGFDLRALGQLPAAAQPMLAGLEMRLAQEDWKNAAINARNLSELSLTLGELPQALAYAQQCIELADRSGDSFERMVERTKLADALHQAGRLAESAAAFREAETLQKEYDPTYPLLYSLRGFQYCDLLLTQGHGQEMRTRAAKFFEWRVPSDSLLDIALDQLALGRAWLWEAQQPAAPAAAPAFAEAGPWLQRAVDGLRQAGRLDYLPLGLLARAAWQRLAGAGSDAGLAARAWRDVNEALRIAQRGSMRLHLADAHLEAARLCLAQRDATQARSHWEQARDLVAQTGYHRRDGEVEELRQALG
ncbi:MAG: TIR domain-containing protein [Acidobacteria bacterium]|nr:TIR domain-containing protein [Acidobacteriota bacterium]MBI3427599.1 TIR domain-containing protein [Acidobacteriota bacterium]